MKFKVDTNSLDQAAAKLHQHAKDCEVIDRELRHAVGSTGAAWEGADQTAFVSEIKASMTDFQKIYTAMKRHADFLENSSKAYRNAQKDILNMARQL
ncbi:hypothetical protein A8F94_09515 [Bacillus sp. FJAT-27225]|uniref:WXG100 family type VII secretion target n=1 Tax=Bacillus sp. FJAT-27225 TaxID=1743144 RepID=UPI00080C310F|nr:WXG100 family type VII secretion target [Bacillus sp. FJAT-27225]OCA88050.1 hypothetical protein A8F94_09515 [Bacillus sp. FJAT-27225]